MCLHLSPATVLAFAETPIGSKGLNFGKCSTSQKFLSPKLDNLNSAAFFKSFPISPKLTVFALPQSSPVAPSTAWPDAEFCSMGANSRPLLAVAPPEAAVGAGKRLSMAGTSPCQDRLCAQIHGKRLVLLNKIKGYSSFFRGRDSRCLLHHGGEMQPRGIERSQCLSHRSLLGKVLCYATAH